MKPLARLRGDRPQPDPLEPAARRPADRQHRHLPDPYHRRPRRCGQPFRTTDPASADTMAMAERLQQHPHRHPRLAGSGRIAPTPVQHAPSSHRGTRTAAPATATPSTDPTHQIGGLRLKPTGDEPPALIRANGQNTRLQRSNRDGSAPGRQFLRPLRSQAGEGSRKVEPVRCPPSTSHGAGRQCQRTPMDMYSVLTGWLVARPASDGAP